MPPLPVLSGAEVMKGSEGRFTVVPVHPGRDIPPGTLRRIIRDAGLSIAEFIAPL
jgi:predicted RNA binding protein YcfA (HicA-like mRNA interferase family)